MKVEFQMRGPKSIILLLAIMINLLWTVLIGGCGPESGNSSKDKKLSHIYENLGPYLGWEKFKLNNIVIIYPPDHPEKEELETFATVFSAMERNIATFLSIEVPDSLTVYFYPNAKHGITVTGFFAPFADNNEVIHFWLPSKIGQPIAQRFIKDWSIKKPKYEFLRQGIIALFDGTGENYHVRTHEFVKDKKFISLEKLAIDSTIDADKERTQSAMAASFVDYVVFTYGSILLKELYESDSDFEADVQQVFGLPVDSLEKNWLNVVEQVVNSLPDSLK